MRLKTDFHMHTRDDPEDTFITHSAFDLIDQAYLKKYDCISITNHNHVTFNEELKNYAAQKGIVLIPGTERTIKGRHVLLINFENPLRIKSFSDLEKYKSRDNLVIAAHPYFPHYNSLRSYLKKYISAFDAIEYSHFYTEKINFFNMKAQKVAQIYNLPMVGNSDTHHISIQFGTTYSYVEAEEKTVDSIIRSIKQGRVSVAGTPLSTLKLIKIAGKIFLR